MSDPSPLLNRIVAIERRLDAGGGGPHDPHTEARRGRLGRGVSDIKAILTRLEPMIVRIDAQFPHLATKAEVAELRADIADKPSRTYLWGVLAALLAAYGCGLAALAILK
jgi:hypothetical protein